MEFNINESKRLKFSIGVAGADTRDLNASFRIKYKGIEYGFPMQIAEGYATVKIPAFTEFIKDVDPSILGEARMDVLAGDTYLNPWGDKFSLKAPIKVEAVMKEEVVETITAKPIVKTELTEEKAEKVEKVEEKKEPVVEKKKTKWALELEKKLSE
jgi:hypothetical protein